MKFLITSKPELGDCRKRLKFAWLPMIANDGNKVTKPTEYWVWLETIELYEEYRKTIEANMVSGHYVEKWVVIDRLIRR